MSNVHTNQTGSSITHVLIAVVAIFFATTMLLPMFLGTPRSAFRVACLGNLKNIGITAATYADTHGGEFPLASGERPPAFASLNILVQNHPELASANFICPVSKQREAEEINGRFQLDATTNSYAWIGVPTLNTSDPKWALGSDIGVEEPKLGLSGNHHDGMNVIYIGGNVTWISLEELPEGWLLPERLVDNSGERPKR